MWKHISSGKRQKDYVREFVIFNMINELHKYCRRDVADLGPGYE